MLSPGAVVISSIARRLTAGLFEYRDGHDDGKLPKHIATEILALIDRLPPGDGLCHTDLSPR